MTVALGGVQRQSSLRALMEKLAVVSCMASNSFRDTDEPNPRRKPQKARHRVRLTGVIHSRLCGARCPQFQSVPSAMECSLTR